MKARLLRHRGIYFLYLNEETIVPMKEDDVREFLKNYADYKYYNDLIDKYSIPALKRRFSSFPEILAVVDENNELMIKDSSLLKTLFSPETESKFISSEDFASKHNKKRSIVLRMCRDGRIPGARLVNSVWVIPSDAPYPEDRRQTKGMKCVYPPEGEDTLNYSPQKQRRTVKEPVHADSVE